MAATKVVKRRKSGLTKTALANRFAQWRAADKDEKAAKARKEADRKELLAWIETHGYYDENGHGYLDLPEPIDGFARLCRQKRVSQSIDHGEAESLLKSKGLWNDCTVVVRTIDEAKLAQAVFEGKLSQEEFDALIVRRETFAFIPVKD